MDFMENPESAISKCLKLLKIHKTVFLGGVNGGILLDHLVSLKHGIKFLGRFCSLSKNKDLKKRIRHSISYVKYKLYLLTYLVLKDESLVMNLWIAYSDLREEMKKVIIKPGTNEYDVIFLKIFTRPEDFSETNLFLCDEIKKLVNSDCKAEHIRSIMKELEDIRKMLTSMLEPFFIYAKDVDWPLKTIKEQEIFTTITAVLDKAMRLIYLSFIRKMDADMVLSVKNSLCDLIIEEPQIMKMYLILFIDSTENLKSHISMSLRLLEWNRFCYWDTEIAINIGSQQLATMKDHFTSIEHVLQFLYGVIEISRDKDLKLHFLHLIASVKQTLYSLSLCQPHEDLGLNLNHAYDELRKEIMHRVAMSFSGSNDFIIFCDFLLAKIREIVSSNCTDQIIPTMKEFKDIRDMLTLSKYVIEVFPFLDMKEKGIEIVAILTDFLGKATSLIDLCLLHKMGEEMSPPLRYGFSDLISKNDIREMCQLVEGKCKHNFLLNIDTSLSLLKRQEEYQIGTINEDRLKDHITSLKHGIEFLGWFVKTPIDSGLEWRIILLTGNVKRKLESLTYEQGGDSLNNDVNDAYADLREEMKNLIINPTTAGYDTKLPEVFSKSYYYERDTDLLLEMITTLVTSSYKGELVAHLKKDLQDLQKILTYLKPLGHYVRTRHILYDGENIFTTFLTKAATPIYLLLVGKMDMELVFLVENYIKTMVKETDVLETYTVIFSMFSSDNSHLQVELHLLESLLTLLESYDQALSEACSILYDVLSDIHDFLLDLSPNVLLKKLHLLQQSFQVILCHSIPIFFSCYLEHAEVDNEAELNCVLDTIKHIKFEAQKVKLYYFPRVDDLGFLEFFLGYLEDLMENKTLPLKEEIDALHFELHSLLSFSKGTKQEELNETPWIDIMNMAYQAEYIIDLYLSSSCSDLELISSLSKIIEQLKNSIADVHDLSHRSLPAQEVAATSKPQVLGTTTTHASDNGEIEGFQEDARIITEYLLTGEKKLDVISIIGMAGVGKTTLASSLYKTPLVADQFDILSWCTVSQRYQNRDVFLTILDQVNSFDKHHRSISDDQELADSLCRSLRKRRYLIILDDIWDATLWSYLKRYLPDDKIGSRILITSRNKDVVVQIGSKVNELYGLSNEKSWELFQKKMLQKGSLSDDLLNISKEIVENCKGLPLSIVIIAGILSGMERTKEKWNQIAKSVSYLVLSDPQGKCNAILELSYHHLPNHLRSCFLYLGIFEEDVEILVDRVTKLWIGEGLVQDTKSDRAEEVANKYVEDLIEKCLVIPAKKKSRGGVKSFLLHDLLLDFCLNKAREKYFFILLLEGRNDSRLLQDPRRLIIDGTGNIDLHLSCHSIRTMMWYEDLSASYIEYMIKCCDMVLIKVLEVYDVLSEDFPDISSLVHLRYLALSVKDSENSGVPSLISKLQGRNSKEISILPLPITKLQNLQILILRFNYLIKVPDLIWDMMKLRHVRISPRASFEVDSNRLENSSFLLENLRSLSYALISWGDSKWLRKLACMQRLSCVFVDDDTEMDDFAKEDDTIKCNKCQVISFNGCLASLKVVNGIGREQRFISTCQLPISLRELTLSEFSLASNDISEIGRAIPHLEVLKIYGCYVPSGYEWNVEDEDFPELKVLKLRYLNMSKWTVSEDSFPGLEQLWVRECNDLDEIPLHFGSSPKLHFISVRECKSSVDHSAREIEKMQHEEQNTEMRVRIYSRRTYDIHTWMVERALEYSTYKDS